MGKITTHVLDLANGAPAAQLLVELHECTADARRAIASARTNASGRIAEPLLEGSALHKARYALTFHVADYYRLRGVTLPDPPFIDKVVIEFGVADAHENYHVPLLISPWSYSTYRGS
jgi:5-hydroxyisourate hydrolase